MKGKQCQQDKYMCCVAKIAQEKKIERRQKNKIIDRIKNYFDISKNEITYLQVQNITEQL